MNSITRTFIPVTCLAAATLSCTRAHGPGEDGETHFLRACVDQCEGALTCLEGVCSAACESSDQCEKYDQTARCVDRSTGLDLEAGESDGMCDRRCTQQSDCVSLGATFGCESAVCREAVEPSPARSPDSGQGNGGTDGGVGDGDVIDSDAEVSRDGEAGRTNGGGEASVDLSPEAGSSSADGWSAVRSLSAAECPEWMPEPGDTCDRPRTPEGEGRCVYCPQDFAGPASVLDCDEAWFESSTDIQCEDLAEAERWVLMPMSSVAGCPEEMPRSERTCHVEDIDDGPGWCLYCHNDGSGTARPYGCDGGWFMYGPAIDCSSLIKGPEDLWCDPAGTWRIDYDSYDACGPSPTETETLTLSFDLETGEDEIVFYEHGLVDATCDGTFEPTYEASVRVWDHGCEVTASSSATWCSSSETQCEDIELLLRIDGDTAAVTGTYRRCWCGGSPAGTQVDVSGTATRLSQ